MLIPRFSTLGLFGLVTAGGFLALSARYAVLGRAWAQAIVTAVAFIFLVLLIHCASFIFTWIAALIFRWFWPSETPTSPFAGDAFPKQIIRPEDPD